MYSYIDIYIYIFIGMHRVLSAIRLLECVFCIWHIWYLVFGDSKIRSFGYCVNRFVHKLVSFLSHCPEFV